MYKNPNEVKLRFEQRTSIWPNSLTYKITFLLDSNNLSLRNYHGITHLVTETATEQRVMDLIVLPELVQYLNDPAKTEQEQRRKYEES